MSSDEFLKWLHLRVHVLRASGIQPTQFEIDVTTRVTELFSGSCVECKDKAMQYKYNPPQVKKSFLGGLFKR